jgi:hypothetical protein
MSNLHLARRGRSVRMAALATSTAIAILASIAAGLAADGNGQNGPPPGQSGGQNPPPGQGGHGQNCPDLPFC